MAGKKRQLAEEEAVELVAEEVEEEEVSAKKQKKEKKDKKEKKKAVKVESEDEKEEEEVVKEEEVVVDSKADRKQSKQAKPLPPGYVCNACGVKDDHAIYNCPLKVSKKAADAVAEEEPQAKKAKTNAPASSNSAAPVQDEKKKVFSVFLSGLPFDMNKQKLLDLITDLDDHGTTLNPRNLFIVHFDDNENRCRGLAYVNCPTKEEFDRTLKLNGVKVGRMNITAVESSSKQQDQAAMGGKKKAKSGETRCYRCGGTHDPKTCTNLRICYKCKGTDHLSKDCPKKKK